MNKSELVAASAAAAELDHSTMTKAVDAVVGTITEALKGGEEVRLTGFGVFSVTDRAASNGRNPRTGEPITIAASKQPRFKAGKGLKDAVN